MKGISDIVAMILLLVITIAIAGLAYAFISGIVSSRTAVAISVASGVCYRDKWIFQLRNDGTAPSGSITVTVYNSTRDAVTTGSCNSIPPGGTIAECSINRPSHNPTGSYSFEFKTSYAVTSAGPIICTETTP